MQQVKGILHRPQIGDIFKIFNLWVSGRREMINDRAGYKRERTYILNRFGIHVRTCHVAHVKRSLGLTRGAAPNRIDPAESKNPCPPHLWPMVEEAVSHIHGARLLT
jgi:hypothetical protein